MTVGRKRGGLDVASPKQVDLELTGQLIRIARINGGTKRVGLPRDIDAACGQLRRKEMQQQATLGSVVTLGIAKK